MAARGSVRGREVRLKIVSRSLQDGLTQHARAVEPINSA